MMLSLDTAYRSFGGEVEASSTPTICRLPDCRRHQLSAIAPLITPFTMPGGNPLIAAPGLTPTFPLITVEPVLVTVEPAKSAKLAAVPRDGACAWLGEGTAAPIRLSTATAPRTPVRFSDDVRTDAGANENLLI